MTVILLALMQAALPIQGTLPQAAAPLSVTEIVDRMVQAESERTATFSGYTAMRRYHFENKKVGKSADVTVRVICDQTGAKTFEVTEESGSGFVRRRIIRRMIDAEREASGKGEHQQTRILPQNYDFTLLGTEVVDGRPSYVLEVSPKSENQFMVRGRIWVDAADFAVTRVEGRPAKNPSFWIRSVKVVHRYNRVGKFWLPVSNQSRADVRVFGQTDVRIEYFDYSITDARAKTDSASGESGTANGQ